MIVTTRFPDLPPQPETAANAAFRRRFFARWGQENSVFLASTRAAEYGPLPTALSFKAVLSGQVAVRLGRRRLTMGAGDGLLVNRGQTYGFSIDSGEPVRCFSVQVRDDLAQELAADARRAPDAALDCPPPPSGFEVAEQLRELEGPLRAALGALVWQVQQGVAPADVEAGFIELVGQALRDDALQRHAAQRSLDAVRPATRAELARRIGWAADFMHSQHAQAIGLADVAGAA
ncbi:MAG TPA: cupin domain-containing protein, partial [Burkholderiaceae bacterium]|nr:cupin domain-containing protein [Burkholderiaceae bacterium]